MSTNIDFPISSTASKISDNSNNFKTDEICKTFKTLKTSCALGFFDGMHLGHTEVVKAALFAAQKLDALPAVFTFDSTENSTRLPKAGKCENIISAEQKHTILKNAGIKMIYSTDFSAVKDLTPREFTEKILIEKLSAVSISCGHDFRFGKDGAGSVNILKSLCEEKGIELNIVPEITVNGEKISSSAIRTLIMSGDIKTANIMLGYKLFYELPVLRGKRLGRQLDAPTINQSIPAGNIVPRFGVYKSTAEYNGESRPAITNIGLKPTLGTNIDSPLMETHIIGLKSEDFYGQSVKVSLLEFIRDEKKFENLNELKEQIKTDVETALS